MSNSSYRIFRCSIIRSSYYRKVNFFCLWVHATTPVVHCQCLAHQFPTWGIYQEWKL
jgi:hypothetical protein